MTPEPDSRAASNWDGAAYDRVSDPHVRWGAAVVDRLQLAGDETVLDAGCGSGRVTELLLDRLPAGRVIAVDASPSMLEAARSRLAPHRGRVTFVLGDLLALDRPGVLPAGPVDAVLSTATFHWITDHDRLFAVLAAVLRPGGQLVAQCGGPGNIDRVIAAVRALGAERAGTWHYASVEDTRARLAAAGFRHVSVWSHPEWTRFDPGEPLESFLEQVCLQAHLATLPEAERRPFVRAVAAALPDATVDYVRLNMVAVRA